MKKVSLPFLWGIKPLNENSLPSIPEIESAVMSDDAPGIGTMLKSPATLPSSKLCTNRHPGSAIPGVPASVTSAIDVPSVSSFLNSSTTFS